MRAALLILLAALVLPIGRAEAQQKVVFGLVSSHAVAHAPLYFAKDLGYWAEEKLDIEDISLFELVVGLLLDIL